MPTARWTSTSGRKPRKGNQKQTGSRPFPAKAGSPTSVSTGRRRLTSTAAGCCRISKKLADEAELPERKKGNIMDVHAKQITHLEELSNLPFVENRPTQETAKVLRDELLFQRATQTYLWALPLINTLGMKVGS